jgi:hypothetical protein
MTREWEHAEFIDGPAKRFILAAGRRAGDGDEIELAKLIGLQSVLDHAIQDAVDAQRARGVSWAGIARATGSTRQAAQQRWGKVLQHA